VSDPCPWLSGLCPALTNPPLLADRFWYLSDHLHTSNRSQKRSGRCRAAAGRNRFSDPCPVYAWLCPTLQELPQPPGAVYIIRTVHKSARAVAGPPSAAADHRRVPLGPYLGYLSKNSLQNRTWIYSLYTTDFIQTNKNNPVLLSCLIFLNIQLMM
jgi:hypothetical protein